MTDRDATADQLEIEDVGRTEFMRALDASDLEVTEWEAKFLGTFKEHVNPQNFWIGSPGRRRSADNMRKSYGPRLGKPPAKSAAYQIPPSIPGRCNYLIRADGRQQRCGLPAETLHGNGLEYCADHARERERWRKHMDEINRRRR